MIYLYVILEEMEMKIQMLQSYIKTFLMQT